MPSHASGQGAAEVLGVDQMPSKGSSSQDKSLNTTTQRHAQSENLDDAPAGAVKNYSQGVNTGELGIFAVNDTQGARSGHTFGSKTNEDAQHLRKDTLQRSAGNSTQSVNNADDFGVLEAQNGSQDRIRRSVDPKLPTSGLPGVPGISGTAGNAAEDMESTVKWLVANGSGNTAVLLLGSEDWVIGAVSVVNQNPETAESRKYLNPTLYVWQDTQRPLGTSHKTGCPGYRAGVEDTAAPHLFFRAEFAEAAEPALSRLRQEGGFGCRGSTCHSVSEVLSSPNTQNFIEAIRVGPGGRFLVGYLGRVVTILAQALDFRYAIMEGSSFGTLTPNRSFDGVVGHIERKEGDLGLASLSISYHRNQAIDYTEWITYHPSLFVTRAPRMFNDPLILFKIYSWQLWGRSPDHPICTDSHFRLSAQPSSFLPQGTNHLPTTTSGRIVYTCSWLIVTIVYALYSGNLTAFLSIPRVDRPPTTVRELVTRNWAFSMNKAFGSYDLIKETKTQDYQTLYRRAEERGLILENSGAAANRDSSEMFVKNVAVVMGETGAFYNMNSNTHKDGRCKLTHGQEDIGKEYAALALPKMSLLKPFFDKKLIWMRQMGIIQKIYKDSFGVKCFRRVQDSGERKALALYQNYVTLRLTN
ncbi:uncharacterized protein LOC135204601 [Macrobrachium nipponense]|uniref:uncharacterized protein LOC135204601 n=1 Tax=Macrobrachium nipponense TaxID=159736 RepID=UPI0030C8A54C